MLKFIKLMGLAHIIFSLVLLVIAVGRTYANPSKEIVAYLACIFFLILGGILYLIAELSEIKEKMK